MKDSPLKALSRLRYSQRWLVFGGGALITLMALLTFALETQATLSKHAEVQRRAFFADHSRVMAEVQARSDAFRTALVSAAMIWNESLPIDRRHVARYRAQRDSLVIQAGAEQPAQWIIGEPDTLLGDDALLRFFSLSVQLGRAAAVEGLVKQSNSFGYFYTVEHDLLGIIPAPGEQDRESYLHDRSQLLGLMIRGVESAAARAQNHEANSASSPVWIPPAINPITGARTFRIVAPIMDGKQPFAKLVMEYDPAALLEELEQGPANGSYLIATREGEVVIADDQGDGQHSRDHLRDIAARTGGEWLEEYSRGLFTVSKRIGDTGWVLVFTHTWHDVLGAIGWQVGRDATMTLFTLALIWALLIHFKLRVVRPLVDRSQRVFESEALSRTLIGTAPVGLGLIDVDTGKPLLMSPAMIQLAERMTPAEPSLPGVIVQRFKERLAKGDISWRLGDFHESMRCTTVYGVAVDLSVSVARARYQGKDVLVAAFNDVTAKSRLEAQLREARLVADQASAAKSAFLAVMSHEIRTPLNAILGNLELLANSPLDPRQRVRLETVQTSSNALLSIVSDVLDFSKIEAGEMLLESIEFDALEVTAHALRVFAPLAQTKGLTLMGDFGLTTRLRVCADPIRLGQVVQNLLSNAIKFTQAGGVTVRVRLDERASRVDISVLDTGIGMTPAQMEGLFRPFSQADASISRRFGGTGLGLALCQKLARAMGGMLSVQSEPEVGSCFTLDMPIGLAVASAELPAFAGESVLVLAASDQWRQYLSATLGAWGLAVQAFQHPAQISSHAVERAAALVIWGERQTWHADDESHLIQNAAWVVDGRPDGPSVAVAMGRVLSVCEFGLQGLAMALLHAVYGHALASQASAAAAADPCRQRVLVVEDNAPNRALLGEQLRYLGCEPYVVEDGLAALQVLRNQRFGALLTDISMPGMDGYELAAHVRTRWPDMPVIALTANVAVSERERATSAGIAAVLGKPLLLADLARALSAFPGFGVLKDAMAGKGGLLGEAAVPDELTQAFLQGARESLALLRQVSLRQDPPALKAELHHLKGMLGVFRRGDLGRLLSEIETGMQQGRPDATQQLDYFLKKLEGALDQSSPLIIATLQ